jgi:hypothetical protein
MKARIGGRLAGSSPAPAPSIQRFFVPGPLPGLNDYISTGSRFTYNKHKKDWQCVIAYHIRRARINPVLCAAFRFTWHEQNRRRNPDNFAAIGKKFIFDALVQCGVLPNDGWNEIVGWEDRWLVNVDRPGVSVEMWVPE